MDATALAALTDAEKEVLRLYLETTDPKQIALRIGRSHHAVDQRLRSARGKLGVSRTLDAARQLAAAEGGATYEAEVWRSIVGRQAPDLALIRPPSEQAGIRRLIPVRGRPWLDEPVWLRLLVIAGGVVLLLVAAILCVSLGESLSRIVRHWS